MALTLKHAPAKKPGRTYETPFGELPSVTTILSVISKPALVNWAANVEREAVVGAAADLYEDAPATPRMSRMVYTNTLIQRLGARKAHERASEKAMDAGSQAHKLIEWNIRRELGQEAGPEPKIGAEAATAFESYQAWRAGNPIAPLRVEQMVYSKAGYAGTLDLMSQADDGIEVSDFKTSSGIYPEYVLQLVAYARALDEMGHGPVRRVRVIRIPKTGGAVEVKVVEADAFGRHFEAFLCALTLYVWQQSEAKR